MTVVSSHRDTEAFTFSITSEFPVSPDRLWQIWEDSQQLARWWGPPTWPATFTRHDFTVDGRSHYYMTGPDGEHAYGAWLVTAIDSPNRLTFTDAFADAEGAFLDDPPPMKVDVTIDEGGPGSRMTISAQFSSLEHLEQVAEMGMEEGMTEALGQVDDLLSLLESN